VAGSALRLAKSIERVMRVHRRHWRQLERIRKQEKIADVA
jgi:hypothetical protein